MVQEQKPKVVAGKVLGIDGRTFKQTVKSLFSEKDVDAKIIEGAKAIATSMKVKFKWSGIFSGFDISSDAAEIQKHLEASKKTVEKTHTEAFDNIIAEAIISLGMPADIQPNGTLWLVIDSLNVLERAIFQRTEMEKYRGAIQGLASALHTRLKEKQLKVVIILTGEYHTPLLDVSGASSESFFSDIEILLSQEPLVGTARTNPRNSAAAGYNIELHENLTAGKDMHHANMGQVIVETRPFCRVLKSRFSDHQSRRCSYKIEKGKGLLFDEAFPGDGYVLLFEDNPRQRDAWLDFLLKDAPHEFPALRHELFDRTHQQRVFSTERCFSGHHHPTDLRLVNLDTYWIKWFTELNQRAIIRDAMRPLKLAVEDWFRNAPDDALPVNKITKDKFEQRVRERFSKAICLIHKEFLLAKKSATIPTFTHTASALRRLARYHKSYTLAEVFPGLDLPKHFKDCWDKFCKPGGILLPISQSQIRLFGEQKSKILPALLIKQDFIELDRDTNDPKLLSVPINANISFLVYRKDLLMDLCNGNNKNTCPDSPPLPQEQRQATLWNGVKNLLGREKKDIETFVNCFWSNRKSRKWRPKKAESEFVCHSNDTFEISAQDFSTFMNSTRAGLKLPQLLSEHYVPGTWEEVIALCEINHWEHLIETRSFDTLLCTFLELVWGCGATLSVDAEYKVKINDDFLARFYQAVFLFQELLAHVPADATLDANVFGKYAQLYPQNGKTTWAFMRQWHSTLVDILISKDKNGEYCWSSRKPRTEGRPQVPEQNSKDELEIAPLPESFWRFYKRSNVGKNENGNPGLNTEQAGQGISCWGDWHLAVLRGSENQKLAVGLLNNLMSSSKVATRALSGAALPAMEKFYDIYKLDPCIYLSERLDDFQMPATNYGQLQTDFFPIARTRSDIFDYRHVMREIHGFVVELVYCRHPRKTPEMISELLVTVFNRIEALSERELLSH